MSFAQILEELPSLTSEERQILIRLASELERAHFTPSEEALFEARLAAHDRNPSTAIPAEALMSRLRMHFSE